MEEPCKGCNKKTIKERSFQSLLTEDQCNKIIEAVRAIDKKIHDTEFSHLNIVTQFKNEKEYFYAIGLMWFYQIWVINKDTFRPSTAYATIKKWDERNADIWIRILKWWILNTDDAKSIIASYIVSILLNKEMMIL